MELWEAFGMGIAFGVMLTWFFMAKEV